MSIEDAMLKAMTDPSNYEPAVPEKKNVIGGGVETITDALKIHRDKDAKALADKRLRGELGVEDENRFRSHFDDS